LHISWLEKEKIYHALNRSVEKEVSLLEKFKEDKVYAELYYPIRLENELKNLSHIGIIEPFFKELYYELMTDQYKLY